MDREPLIMLEKTLASLVEAVEGFVSCQTPRSYDEMERSLRSAKKVLGGA